MKNLVTSANLQPVLCLQKRKKSLPGNWFLVAKQNLRKVLSIEEISNVRTVPFNQTLELALEEILPSLSIDKVTDEFPVFIGSEKQKKIAFLCILYIVLYLRFPSLYFFLFSIRKRFKLINRFDQNSVWEAEQKKPLDIEVQTKFKLKEKLPQESFYIDFIAAIYRITTHCFNVAGGAVHLHDLVKIFNLPNLFLSDFIEERIPNKYYEGSKEVNIIINLLSIHLTAIAYTYFLNKEINITESKLLERPFKVAQGYLRKVREKLGVTPGHNLNISDRRIKVVFPLEFGFQGNGVPKTFVAVFDILPSFENLFPKHGNPLVLVTLYFDLPKKKRDEAPNTGDLKGGTTKNFQTSDEALEPYWGLFKELQERYPLNDLLQQIMSLKNDPMLLIDQDKFTTSCNELLQKILTEFLSGENFYDCLTLTEFKERVNKLKN